MNPEENEQQEGGDGEQGQPEPIEGQEALETDGGGEEGDDAAATGDEELSETSETETEATGEESAADSTTEGAESESDSEAGDAGDAGDDEPTPDAPATSAGGFTAGSEEDDQA